MQFGMIGLGRMGDTLLELSIIETQYKYVRPG